MNISIIIPTCNRIDKLKQCLDSLFIQDYTKGQIQIIVVDDSDSPSVAQLIKETNKENVQLIYLSQKQKGPAVARNLGVQHAQNEIIAFVDDDCIVEKKWIRLMQEAHKKYPEIDVIGGDTITPEQKITVLISQYLSTCSIEMIYKGKKEVIFFPTCNVSFKRKVFDRYRFNEAFPLPGGEDLEFFWRLFKDGFRFIWDKDIKVKHYRSSSLKSFLDQSYIYGRGNFLTQAIHKDHPLLGELNPEGISFWKQTLKNIIKIPKFSYFFTQKFFNEYSVHFHKTTVYLYFILHKTFYVAGNIAEYFLLRSHPVKGQKVKERYVPQRLILDITHRCNLSCRICDIWQTQNKERDIDIVHIKHVLKEASEMHIPEIAFSGGEPLYRPDIFEIFDYVESLGLKDVGVLSNGIIIPQIIDRLKPYLMRASISLVISLDSLKPELHNSIRHSQNAWQKTMDALKVLSSLKEQHSEINFNIITIVLNQNLEELIDIVHYIKSTGAGFLQFQPLLPNNLKMAERKKTLGWIPNERIPVLEKTMKSLQALKKVYPDFIKNSIRNLSLMSKYFEGSLSSSDTHCVSAQDTILISNQGMCTTCFASYGNIKAQNLKKIFLGEERTQAYQQVQECAWPCLLPCFCDQ